MALQTRDMVMQGLGVMGDAPPNSLQPALVDGVHLRWAFLPEHGFPLHGFYLFRRSHREGSPQPLSGVTGGLDPGPLPDNRLDTLLGEVSSDVNLVLRDDFPPGGAVEFDLDGRDHLRFELPEGEPARRVEVRIGFRKRPGEPAPAKRCVSFTNRPNETGPNPRTEQGVMFETLDQHGRPRPHTHVRERQIQGGKISGLDCEWELVITLPDDCSSVELTLTPLGSPATVEAYNEDGSSAGITTTSGNRRSPETVRLTGRAINRVVVRARQTPPATQTLLNQVCFERVAATSRIRVTAFLGDVPVASADAEGRPGEIVPRMLEFDAISAVEIEGGPAALVELGVVPVSQDATVGWELIPGFSYPMHLPVTHPDYPCTPGQGEDLQAARDLARDRVLYGDPNQFTAEPAPIHTAGTVALTPGSPVVTGSGTGWGPDLAGATLHVDSDPTAYVVAAVISPDKVVLGRDYGGTTGSGKTYALNRDEVAQRGDFAQLHDHLAHLVAGGEAAGPMHTRYQPVPAHDEGTISVTAGSSTVTGSGTGWDAVLEDLRLWVTESRGTVSVAEGEEAVEGSGTDWGSELAGQTFEVPGERTQYTIARVDSPTRLMLDRDYEGGTGSGKAYAIVGKVSYAVANVDSPTQLALDRPYAEGTRSGSSYVIAAGGFQTEGDWGTVPSMPRQYTLGLVLLSTLHPALAQIVGLYWVDQEAEPGVAHDYLLVADYAGHGELNSQKILGTLQQSGFGLLEGYIVFNKKAEPASVLPPPEDLRVYALPGGAPGDASETPTIAGLRWNLGRAAGELLPEGAIMYHLWRADLGDQEPTSTPPPHWYDLLTENRSLLVAEPQLPPNATPQRPAQWPAFPMHAIDGHLSDGWYSYQVSGIDIFGRHSARSGPVPWYQWEPPPEPRPWYYEDPPGHWEVHPLALNVPDRMPPPPPTGVEAYALDPEDPTVLRDTAYDAWYASLSAEEKRTLIGLRVRWLWTEAQMQQAPDLREFRIYYHRGPFGQMNALLGEVRGVLDAGTFESTVETDIEDTRPADAYVGASLWVAQDGFAVLASEAVASGPGGPPRLRLRVKNVGPSGTVRPPADVSCTLAIPPLHAQGSVSVENGSATVNGTATYWTAHLAGMPMRFVGELAEYSVLRVDSPTELTLDRPYAGTSDNGKGYGVRHPLFVDYGTPSSWEQRYHVVDADQFTATTTPDGQTLRRYEVFLPTPRGSHRQGLPLEPSLDEPIAYAHVGVSAADDKDYVPDDPTWVGKRWGNRPGNEGRMSHPAKIFRVLRKEPQPPAPPPDAERVFATAADYHGRSYYSYRWQPVAHLKTHVFRALDDALFRADWEEREVRPREPLKPSQTEFFPDQAIEPRWNGAKRRQVADELNHLNDFEQDVEGAMAYYRGLSNDALRVLAGLPGNEGAFAQLTIQPLDPDDLDNADRRGPDSPDGYVPNPNLRAYEDILDGRSTNRYFYRAAYVDGAHNLSELSLSSPPIYLPNVVPPAPPIVQLALAGDGEVRLQWLRSPEPTLARYLVFRAADETTAADVRRMVEVAWVAPTPTSTPGEGEVLPAPVANQPDWLEHTDFATPGQEWFYRLQAVDLAGNVSPPSELLRARSLKPPPPPPTWSAPVRGTTTVTLRWSHATEPQLSCLVERRAIGGTLWRAASPWLPRGVYTFEDAPLDLAAGWEYRLRVRDNLDQPAATLPTVTLEALQ